MFLALFHFLGSLALHVIEGVGGSQGQARCLPPSSGCLIINWRHITEIYSPPTPTNLCGGRPCLRLTTVILLISRTDPRPYQMLLRAVEVDQSGI